MYKCAFLAFHKVAQKQPCVVCSNNTQEEPLLKRIMARTALQEGTDSKDATIASCGPLYFLNPVCDKSILPRPEIIATNSFQLHCFPPPSHCADFNRDFLSVALVFFIKVAVGLTVVGLEGLFFTAG